MVGFHLFERSSEELSDVEGIPHGGDTHLHPLSTGNLDGDDTTISVSVSSFTVPTGLETEDRGKRLCLAKSLVLLQTSWFILQCIERTIKHSHPSRNGDACLCGHEFPDIRSLVE